MSSPEQLRFSRLGAFVSPWPVSSWVVAEWPFRPGVPFRLRGKEIVAIRHAYLRQARGIEDVGVLDDVVSIEHVGRHGVDFVRSERPRVALGHRAVAEIPDGRG